MRNQLPALRAGHSPVAGHRPPRWRSSAIALAAALVLGSAAWDAHALALGRVNVQSALGEPLRAEIDVPQITPEEAASLRASVAAPEAFREAGVDYNQVLANARVSLERRPNGNYYLRLTSDRAVVEPFLDVMVEATWASGRIVRDFTMLLDPPRLQQAAAQPLPAQVTAPPERAAPASTASSADRGAAPPRATAAAPRRGAAAAPARPAIVRPVIPERTAQRATVAPGDTASEIASANRPATVSLDQMLVAMLRSNPEAFIGGNMNRLKAGAVLDLPTTEQAGAIARAEARRIVVAQSRDFNEFRRRLAQGVVATPGLEEGSRAASGRLQAQVQEKSPTASRPDKLTLSKAATVQGRGAGEPTAEERIARERAAQETATRVAELNRNIAELSRLSAATTATATATATPTSAAAGPGPATPATAAAAPATAAANLPTLAIASPALAPALDAARPGEPAAPAPQANATATPPAPAAPQAAAASAAAAPKETPAPASQPEPAFASALLDDLVADPVVPAAAAGVLALLLGLGLFRLRRRQKASHVDSSFLESRLQPDSFFGASGGQRIDTAETSHANGSSMVYSPSQLDAAGDVDPVAEADVYLAYGRDLQAEEILKEALRTNPQRIAIHGKLLEIYAKRRDLKAFELIAAEAHALAQGTGPDWRHISQMGQELDPDNPLYQPENWQPGSSSGRSAATAGLAATAGASLLGTQYITTDEADEIVEVDQSPSSSGLDLDLDLDFLPEEPAHEAPRAASDSGFTQTAADLRSSDALELQDGVGVDLASAADVADLADVAGAAEVSDAADGPVADIGESPAGLASEPDDGMAWDPVPLPTASQVAAPPPLAESVGMELPDLDLGLPQDLGADLQLDFEPATAASVASPALSSQPSPDLQDAVLEFPAAAPAPALADNSFSFDLDGLSLDLDSRLDAGLEFATAADAADAVDADADPLSTKLSLAQEFMAIGDADGARSLAEEVLAEAGGDLKQQAERFLAELG